MADYNRIEVPLATEVPFAIQVLYTLLTPTNWTEVSKVYAAINDELPSECLTDDYVNVYAKNGELVFSFKKPDRHRSGEVTG